MMQKELIRSTANYALLEKKFEGKHRLDPLRLLAEKYIDDPRYTFEIIKGKNLTDVFWHAIERYMTQKTVIVINFNGHTTDGKSTAAAALTAHINERYLGRTMKSEYILGNQQEYSYWVDKHSNEQNLVLQIDEFSTLATTGENASIEQSFFEEISNIHAQMYIHRIYCSPKAIPDPNCIIHLEVADKNIGKQFTMCYLYYNLTRGGVSYPQLLGHIVINVAKVLESAWYKEYRDKKFQKIELLRNHKIYHERELIYAGAQLATIEYMNGTLALGSVPNSDEIKQAGKRIAERQGIKLSIWGAQLTIVDVIKPILTVKLRINKLNDEITSIRHKINKSDNMLVKEQLLERYKLLKETVTKQKDMYTESINELCKKKALFEEYKKI